MTEPRDFTASLEMGLDISAEIFLMQTAAEVARAAGGKQAYLKAVEAGDVEKIKRCRERCAARIHAKIDELESRRSDYQDMVELVQDGQEPFYRMMYSMIQRDAIA